MIRTTHIKIRNNSYFCGNPVSSPKASVQSFAPVNSHQTDVLAVYEMQNSLFPSPSRMKGLTKSISKLPARAVGYANNIQQNHQSGVYKLKKAIYSVYNDHISLK